MENNLRKNPLYPILYKFPKKRKTDNFKMFIDLGTCKYQDQDQDLELDLVQEEYECLFLFPEDLDCEEMKLYFESNKPDLVFEGFKNISDNDYVKVYYSKL